MQTFYKIFLVIFLILIGFNLYVFEWDLGVMHEENSKFILSISAAIIGIVLIFVMNTWSKLSVKNKDQ